MLKSYCKAAWYHIFKVVVFSVTHLGWDRLPKGREPAQQAGKVKWFQMVCRSIGDGTLKMVWKTKSLVRDTNNSVTLNHE